jgi:branched-chain amino acid transport system ATP-binding protein
MSDVALECRQVTSGYGDVPVVRGLDLTVSFGEVVALLGPNGAGKTTTLLTMAGVLSPSAGTVTTLGEPVKGGSPHRSARRGIALVPDNRSLFYGLTAAENVRLGVRGMTQAQALESVLRFFPQLESRMSVRAGLLSGGEQQMLAIGRALVGRPRALMIDELSLGLAPIIVRSILPTIREVADELGTAVLVVEQHVDMALEVADRAYVLSHGEVVTEGPARELAQSRQLLEASYMGEGAAT